MTASDQGGWWDRRAFAALFALAFAVEAHGECTERPFAGERLSVVSEQAWVRGMSMAIMNLPGLDAATARDRFTDFWRKDHRETRVASSSGIEVVSTIKNGCVYALQVPTDGSIGMPARLVVSDLHRAQPTLPRAFEWPPADEADILTDTVSEDGKQLNRVLTYRVQSSMNTTAAQCIKRLSKAAWSIDGVTIMNSRQVTFSGRKGSTSVEGVIVKDGSTSVVTMNFTERNG